MQAGYTDNQFVSRLAFDMYNLDSVHFLDQFDRLEGLHVVSNKLQQFAVYYVHGASRF